jgi:multiple sugar transport system permease protein
VIPPHEVGTDRSDARRVLPRLSHLELFRTDLFRWVMLAPSLLLLLGVSVFPLLYSVQISLFSFRFGSAYEFVGLDNYAHLFQDLAFWSALVTTAVFTFFAVTVEFLLGLGLALLVAGEFRFKGLFRTAFMLPMVVTPVIVGITWRFIFTSDLGVVSYLTKLIFGKQFNFLSTPELALPAVIVVNVWEWTSFMFLILLAGVQSLPTEPFEAARVDGASSWQTFRDFTLPLLRPVILVALLIRTMDAFTTFDSIFILTAGGPGTSTETLSLYVYDTAFRFSQLGYAAAMVFAILLLLVAVSRLFIRFLGQEVGTA